MATDKPGTKVQRELFVLSVGKGDSALLRCWDMGLHGKPSQQDLIQHSCSAWGMLQILCLRVRGESAGVPGAHPACDTWQRFTEGWDWMVGIRGEDGKGGDLECKTGRQGGKPL